MEVVDIPIICISAAIWNANEMDPEMEVKLRRSIERFSLLVPLVVREVADQVYETIGGAQRLAVVRSLGYATVPCVVVKADDGEARLLSQALNHIAGQDNPGLQGEILRRILESTPESEVADLLPGSLERLKELTRIGQEDLAAYLQSKQQVNEARLEHMIFQLSGEQLATVRSALRKASNALQGGNNRNPNRRGNALASICKKFLEEENQRDNHNG